ncbi:MAG: DUF2251 domain-containing protein [Chitinophagaceae bacterium]
MKGYLLKEQKIIIGKETILESVSSENNFEVIFEDDTETGYFYGAERNKETNELRVLDMLLIYDVDSVDVSERLATLAIIWSTDWMKCGLILNNYCHALFDFSTNGGYNRREFPPPNTIWTKQDRKLTNEMIAEMFDH